MSKLICPGCGSSELLVYAETAYWMNTGDFFCHAVKPYDSGAKVSCTACDWKGTRKIVESTQQGGAE